MKQVRYPPTLSVSTTNSTTVFISNSELKVGFCYLRCSGGSIKLDRNSTTTYLFVETEGIIDGNGWCPSGHQPFSCWR